MSTTTWKHGDLGAERTLANVERKDRSVRYFFGSIKLSTQKNPVSGVNEVNFHWKLPMFVS